MTKSTDSLQQYVSLRAALERERESLQARLKQIEAALGSGGAAAAPRRGRPPGSTNVKHVAAPAKAAKRGARPGARNQPSMRETISKLVAKNPMRIGDIVAGMKRSGYVFKSSNPTNSVGAYLYGSEGKKHFTRADGKFSAK